MKNEIKKINVMVIDDRGDWIELVRRALEKKVGGFKALQTNSRK